MSVRHFAAISLLLAWGTSCAAADKPVVSSPPSEWTKACKDWDDWDKPGPPFRIYGNSYYVGTCGISAILVTSDKGHVLIDTGTEGGADVVLANIAKLGFRPDDVRIILTSHEHFDHIGGLAKIKAATGARIITSPEAASVVTTGKASADDPQFGMHDPMAPAKVDEILDATGLVQLGQITMHAIPTPGHTSGALSWYWESCDAGECHTLAYADSMSPVSNESYRFSDHPAYVASYRDGISHLAHLQCDILLTPHPSASSMPERLSSGSMVDGKACADYAAAITKRLDERLAKESS